MNKTHVVLKEKIRNAAKDSQITTVEINEQHFKCLLDTGAEIYTISELFYKQFLHQKILQMQGNFIQR